MKTTLRVALLAVLAVALPLIADYGQSAAAKTSQQSTAKPPAPKPATPPAAKPKTASPPGATPPKAPGTAALVAKGKTLFQSYGCKDCHGEHGEGTDDGPDLISTILNADQIGAFLNKPSVDAGVKGMPAIPPTSPDLKPLVAFVLSLKASKAK